MKTLAFGWKILHFEDKTMIYDVDRPFFKAGLEVLLYKFGVCPRI